MSYIKQVFRVFFLYVYTLCVVCMHKSTHGADMWVNNTFTEVKLKKNYA